LGLGSSAFAKLNGLDRKHGWRMCSLASPISNGTVIFCLGNGRRRALPDPTAKIPAVLTERLAKERDFRTSEWSACGTKRTWRDVRYESVMRFKPDVT